MHLKRLAVALITLPIFYLYIMNLSHAYFLLFLLVASVIAQWEFYSMYHTATLMKFFGILSGISVLMAAYISKDMLLDILVISLMVISSLRLLWKKDPTSSLQDVSPVIVSLLYIPGLLCFQVLLRDNSPLWIIFLYGTVWAADSLAYYVGKSMGKTKLYKTVSPNKTIAGAVGSVIGGSLSGALLNIALINLIPLWKSVLIGTLIGAITIMGDLVESMFKRDAGVKDSGTIIPGHGGLLDKLDGALFAGPVLYWALIAFK